MAHSGGQAESTQESGSERSPEPVAEKNTWLGQLIIGHLGLLLASLPIVLAIIRLIRVSDLDPTLLLTLLQTLNVASLLLATLTQHGPFLVFFLALMLGIFRARREELSPQFFLAVHLLFKSLLFVGFFAIFLISIEQLLLLACYAGAYIGCEAFFAWRDRRAQRSRPRGDLVALSMALLATIIVTPKLMWLPPEAMTMVDGSQRVGYVLSSDDKRILLLTDKDRLLLAVKADQIKTRQPCKLHSSSRPMISVISGESGPKVMECPE